MRKSFFCGTATLFGCFLNHTHCDSSIVVSHYESSKRRVVSERLNAHRLHGLNQNHGTFSSFDELWFFFNDPSSFCVELGFYLNKFAGNKGSVAVDDRSVSIFNLTRVVQDNDISQEGLDFWGGIVLWVTANIPSLNLIDWKPFYVESYNVSRDGLGNRLVIHFNRINFSFSIPWGKGEGHPGFEDAGCDPSYKDSSNTSNIVSFLNGESERFFSGSFWRIDVIKGFQEGGSFVPESIGGFFY